ncbi:MFS general substrate transporter [Eremomyces bilateralis CBS 781.70]|uniref:MFS general substrate transporter n=1 Tax=Eremomyces bilateralis CBS 781.70 TaxID=1392243 RepID=A0A6G1FZL2_9PEZI|nr:MFS general substrate transporter [Eremomyces bilateralis CBS 781.70]KAF1811305.1 MFS general substrate transporter [Eremomyces bilateralis CBS 781.70]
MSVTLTSSPSKEGVVTPPSDLEGAQPREKSDLAPHPRENISQWRWILTMIGIYLGGLLFGLDTTIAAAVQGPVYETLGEIEKLPWIGIGFPMGSVAVILLVGTLFALFDIKVLILSFIFLFEVGSAICGAAPTTTALIIGRVIAGIGGAGMYIGALNYISAFATPSEAPLYNASIGLSWGVGAILGPVIGGAFSDSSATWRWAFYINLPLAGVLSPVYFFAFPSKNPRPMESVMAKLKQVDWVGAILNAGVFVLFQVVLTFSGSTYPWNSGFSIAVWTVWGVVLVLFIIQQGWTIFTTKENRIFPVHFLKSRTLVLLFIATSACAASPITIYYIPLYFQFTRGDSALTSAVRLLPFIFINIFFMMVSGALLQKFGRYAALYFAGGAFILTGGILLFTADPSTSVARIYGAEVLLAAGTGLAFQNAYAVAAVKVDDNDKYNAIRYMNVAQPGAASIGLSIVGCLFQNLGFLALRDALGSYDLPEDAIRSALAGTQSAVFRSGNDELAHLAINTVAETISRIFGAVVAAGALLMVTALLMRWERLNLGARTAA